MPLSLVTRGPLPSVGSLRIAACGEHVVGDEWSIWDKGPYRTWNHCAWHILDGSCTLAFDGGEWELGPGHVHLIPGHRFARRRTRFMRHRWINYNLDQLSDDLHLGQLGQPLSFPLAECRPWVEALADAAQLGMAPTGQAESASPYVIARIEGFLLQAVACAGARSGAPAAQFGGEVLRTALAYIERHYRRMPSLAEIAQACGRSPNHLQSMFSDAFGASPTVYARECRMRDAVHLLIASKLKVQDVARRCGYEDPLHFSRVFSRYFGCSPLTVRQHPDRGSPVWTTLDRSRIHGARTPLPPHGVATGKAGRRTRGAKR
jgi:AraC-like DNA-binding protein